jgi:hypothetical protein
VFRHARPRIVPVGDERAGQFQARLLGPWHGRLEFQAPTNPVLHSTRDTIVSATSRIRFPIKFNRQAAQKPRQFCTGKCRTHPINAAWGIEPRPLRCPAAYQRATRSSAHVFTKCSYVCMHYIKLTDLCQIKNHNNKAKTIINKSVLGQH